MRQELELYDHSKNLTYDERILSIITALPFGNYLKSEKHLKNVKKILKAVERA